MSLHDDIDEYLYELKEEIFSRLSEIDVAELVNKMAAEEIKEVINRMGTDVSSAIKKMQENIKGLQEVWASDDNKATHSLLKRMEVMSDRIYKLEQLMNNFRQKWPDIKING